MFPMSDRIIISLANDATHPIRLFQEIGERAIVPSPNSDISFRAQLLTKIKGHDVLRPTISVGEVIGTRKKCVRKICGKI